LIGITDIITNAFCYLDKCIMQQIYLLILASIC
jgi:hypothetical protein